MSTIQTNKKKERSTCSLFILSKKRNCWRYAVFGSSLCWLHLRKNDLQPRSLLKRTKRKKTKTENKKKQKQQPPQEEKKIVYYVQANDPDPYKVILDFKRRKHWENPDIFVYKKLGDETYNEKTNRFEYETEPVLSLKEKSYRNYHIACDYLCLDCSIPFSMGEGTSFLVYLQKNKYIFIGQNIVWFTMMDRFLSFQDWGGRDNAQLPFISGEKYVYLPVEQIVLDKKFLVVGEAPYVQYVRSEYPRVKENAIVPFEWNKVV